MGVVGMPGVIVLCRAHVVSIGIMKGFAKPVNERGLQELQVFKVISKRVTGDPVAIGRL